MFYSSQPEELRKFIRDKLGFSATDVGDGWLIFDIPEADMGVHPVEKGEAMGPPSGRASISFYCDNLQQTINTLRLGGIEFTDDISDGGYGLTIDFKMSGNFEAELYQPHHRKGQ